MKRGVSLYVSVINVTSRWKEVSLVLIPNLVLEHIVLDAIIQSKLTKMAGVVDDLVIGMGAAKIDTQN